MRRRLNARDDAIGMGIEVRAGGVYVALVSRDPIRVIGLGAGRFGPGSKGDQGGERPAQAASALRQIIGRVHWATPPIVAVVVEPVDPQGEMAAVEAPVLHRSRIGTAWAGAGAVNTAVEIVTHTGLSIDVVDWTPAAVARFAHLAQPSEPVIFARGGTGPHRWTACSTNLSLEAETSAPNGRAAKVRIGSDLTDLRRPQWGDLVISKRVRKAKTAPGFFTAAVGAALGAVGEAPHTNFIGPEAERAERREEPASWIIERIRQ